ncbi:MAG: hypothetical protein AB7K24_11845 [Gemmataceae bacterium]
MFANMNGPGTCDADPVVEVSLLLAEPQMAALKDAADCRGLTVAQLLRSLIRQVTDDEMGAIPIC